MIHLITVAIVKPDILAIVLHNDIPANLHYTVKHHISRNKTGKEKNNKQNLIYPPQPNFHPPYPAVEDLLYWLRVIKHHKAKVGQLSTTVDPQVQDRSVLCRTQMANLSIKSSCLQVTRPQIGNCLKAGTDGQATQIT